MKQLPLVSVVGSLNVDQTFRVPRIPSPGETLMASEVTRCFGGKGANQAVAAVRAGAAVRMIGCLGADENGNRYREQLTLEGIDFAGVRTSSRAATGLANIVLEESGENTIVVDPGANHELTAEHIDFLSPLLEGVGVVLLQLECPLPTVANAARLAKASGALVILNPSPWDEGILECALPVDVLIVNESEAESFFGACGDAAEALDSGLVSQAVIVTRGAQATQVFSAGGNEFELIPPGVTPFDTVGAGDAFAGAFAVAQAEGRSLFDSVRMANAAGALATLKAGAQTAIPRRVEIDALIEERAAAG